MINSTGSATAACVIAVPWRSCMELAVSGSEEPVTAGLS